jgi:hypothetical protein
MEANLTECNGLRCLACGHRFLSRKSGSGQHRCGQCGSSSTVAENDLTLASLALKPWAYLVSGLVPPPPLPHELLGFPAALAAYARVMAQASREEAQRRAIGLMLLQSGFSQDQATELVARWESHEN